MDGAAYHQDCLQVDRRVCDRGKVMGRPRQTSRTGSDRQGQAQGAKPGGRAGAWLRGLVACARGGSWRVNQRREDEHAVACSAVIGAATHGG